MIRTDFFRQREDGVNLYRTYSNADMMILQTDTGELYEEAIDVEGSAHAYEETNTPIDIGDPPDGIAEAAAYLLKAKEIEIVNDDEAPDYFHEHEPEPDYFG